MEKEVQPPILMAIEGVNPVAAVLREMAAASGLSYRQISSAIEEDLGVKRSMSAVANCLSGKKGKDREAFGVRVPSTEEGRNAPTALLVFEVLRRRLPVGKQKRYEERFEEAWQRLWRLRAAKIEMKGASLPSLDAYMGYFRYMRLDLRFQADKRELTRVKQPLSAHSSGAA